LKILFFMLCVKDVLRHGITLHGSCWDSPQVKIILHVLRKYGPLNMAKLVWFM